jgi:hypothetical protein
MIQPAAVGRCAHYNLAGILESMSVIRRIGIVLSLAVVGCGGGAGDNLPRQAVSGSVTLNDKPLEQGSITFSPAEPGQQGAASAGAVIKSGSYSIARTGGPTPGKYRVSIVSEAAGAAEELPGMPPKVTDLKKRALVPEKYNVKSSLTAEVTADGPNTFDFDLKSP